MAAVLMEKKEYVVGRTYETDKFVARSEKVKWNGWLLTPV